MKGGRAALQRVIQPGKAPGHRAGGRVGLVAHIAAHKQSVHRHRAALHLSQGIKAEAGVCLGGGRRLHRGGTGSKRGGRRFARGGRLHAVGLGKACQQRVHFRLGERHLRFNAAGIYPPKADARLISGKRRNGDGT